MPESDEKDHSETVAIAENVLCKAFGGDVRLKMEAAYRAELVEGCPEAKDDTVLSGFLLIQRI